MSYGDLVFSFRMDTSTVCTLVKETMNTLWKQLYPIHMPVLTKNDFSEIARDFYIKWDSPHCIGAIDCQHIRIKKPA